MAEQSSSDGAPDLAHIDVLSEPSCLLNILRFLDSSRDLCSAFCVAKVWRSVAEIPQLWKDLYIRLYGEPLPCERTPRPIQQFKRLAALRNLSSIPRTKIPLKARAACYCSVTGFLVLLDNALNIYFWSLYGAQATTRRMHAGDLQQPVDKPLLASCGTGLVVAAASDGTIQERPVWDCTTQHALRSLSRHAGCLMDLAADGNLVASTCGRELKLWSAGSGHCLLTRPHNSPIDLADIAALGSPKVAVSQQHQLALVMNHHFPPSNTVEVLSTAPGTLGQRLICLDANATVDVTIRGSSIFVASCFQSRSLSAASLAADRFYSVVVTAWDVHGWSSTRLISPRMRIAHGAAALRDLPLLHATGDLLLCGLLADDAASRMPFCCVSAWQLGAGWGQQRQEQQRGRASSPGSNGAEVVRMSSLSPSKRPAGSCNDAASSSAARDAGTAGSSSSSSTAGAVDAGHSSLLSSANAGSSRPQPRSSSTVMLVVGEEQRQPMLGLVEDTQHKLSSLLATPGHLVYTTDTGGVFVHELLPQGGP